MIGESGGISGIAGESDLIDKKHIHSETGRSDTRNNK